MVQPLVTVQMNMKNDQAYCTSYCRNDCWKLVLVGTVAVKIQLIISILNWNKLIEVRFFFRQTQFWVAHLQQEAASCLTEKAVEVLIQFGTTYLCESWFSTLTYFKKQIQKRSYCWVWPQCCTEKNWAQNRHAFLKISTSHTPLIRTVCVRVFWSTSVWCDQSVYSSSEK